MAAKWQTWIPLHINRLRGSLSVQAMSGNAFKGYLFLLMAAWETDDCTIPSSDSELAVLSGLGAKWKTNSSRILQKFSKVENGRLRNSAEYELWLEAKTIFESRKNAAKRTNLTRSPLRSPSYEKDGHRNGHRPTKAAVTDPFVGRSADTVTVTVTETVKQGNARGASPPPEKPNPNPDAVPDGLIPIQYAGFVLGEANVVAGFALKAKTGEAIEMLAKIESCGMPEATQRMLARMREAQDRGETVNSFWLEDGRWKADSGKRKAASGPDPWCGTTPQVPIPTEQEILAAMLDRGERQGAEESDAEFAERILKIALAEFPRLRKIEYHALTENLTEWVGVYRRVREDRGEASRSA